jgi:hypothetical protein
VGAGICRQMDPDTLHYFSALTPCFIEMCLTLIVNILDLLALLSPTALEIQGIPGSLAWCGNLATRALGMHRACPRPRQRLS